MVAPVLTAAGAVAAVTLVHVRDPYVDGSYAACPWLVLTGIACPGCGGLRALHDLTHGDLVAAVSSNLAVVAILLPLAVLGWSAWTRARWRDRPFLRTRTPAWVAWSLAAALLTFGVVRNLAVGSWLAP